MSEKKYIFTGEEKQLRINFRIVTLHRIKAIRTFGDVMTGDLGGWVEKHDNLSHDGTAWVYDDAMACDSALICGDAQLRDTALAQDFAKVFGNSKISGNAIISQRAVICGKAQISDEAEITDTATIGDDAIIRGNAKISGNVLVGNGAEISTTEHILVVGPIGSRDAYTIFYRNTAGSVSVRCGCFNGNAEYFLDSVNNVHKGTKHAKLYEAAARLARLQIQGIEER